MKNKLKKRRPISAEAIARMADQGKDISRFFANRGRMIYPIRRVNVIMSEKQYDECVSTLLELESRDHLSPAEENFTELLTLLIEVYEDKHHPIPMLLPAKFCEN
jgi:hypothetical protein